MAQSDLCPESVGLASVLSLDAPITDPALTQSLRVTVPETKAQRATHTMGRSAPPQRT